MELVGRDCSIHEEPFIALAIRGSITDFLKIDEVLSETEQREIAKTIEMWKENFS